MAHSKVYQPIIKRLRRLGMRLTEKSGKYIAKRPYPPGVHGPKKRRRPTDYGIRLAEKQKVQFSYGLREKALRRFYQRAVFSPGPTGENLLKLLERRLDSVVYRAGLASTIRQARQLVSHRHIRLNGRKVSFGSIQVKVNDVIERDDHQKIESNAITPDWITLSNKQARARITRLPTRSDIPEDISEQLIVEFYAK